MTVMVSLLRSALQLVGSLSQLVTTPPPTSDGQSPLLLEVSDLDSDTWQGITADNCHRSCRFHHCLVWSLPVHCRSRVDHLSLCFEHCPGFSFQVPRAAAPALAAARRSSVCQVVRVHGVSRHSNSGRAFSTVDGFCAEPDAPQSLVTTSHRFGRRGDEGRNLAGSHTR